MKNGHVIIFGCLIVWIDFLNEMGTMKEKSLAREMNVEMIYP